MIHHRPALPWIAALCAALFVWLAHAAQAQFTARIVVGDRAITDFEIEQRALMLAALRTPGDLRKLAEDALIEDRLAEQAARRAGISIAPDEVTAGVEEFAARFNITADQLLTELQAAGVYPQTVRDFVAASLAWRQVVAQKFRAQAQVSDAELDAALASGTGGGLQVLLSEIVLPLTPGFENQTLQLARDLARNLRSEEDFTNAAQAYSASPSRANGGKLDWLPLSQFPPAIVPTILTLAPGQISQPVQLPGAVAIFRMRGLREAATQLSRPAQIDYAVATLPAMDEAGLARIEADLRARVETCHDLQIAVQAMKGARFVRETRTRARIPRDIARVLGHLDKFEFDTALRGGTGGNRPLVVMLCDRSFELAQEEREKFRQALIVQRLEAFGRGWMDELKADAIILRK